jgi:hypothetical protein
MLNANKTNLNSGRSDDDLPPYPFLHEPAPVLPGALLGTVEFCLLLFAELSVI